jgi:hypothetical protein
MRSWLYEALEEAMKSNPRSKQKHTCTMDATNLPEAEQRRIELEVVRDIREVLDQVEKGGLRLVSAKHGYCCEEKHVSGFRFEYQKKPATTIDATIDVQPNTSTGKELARTS